MNNKSTDYAFRIKSRRTDEIRRTLAAGDYAKAKSLSQNALAEFPDDAELLALEEEAIHARERSAQAYQLMEEGHQLCAEQNFEEGLQVLRNAIALDRHNSVIRSVLVDSLLCHARTMLESDLASAERLTQEAIEIDPANPIAKSLTRTILDRKRLRQIQKSSPAAAQKPSNILQTPGVQHKQPPRATTVATPLAAGKPAADASPPANGSAGGRPADAAWQPAKSSATKPETAGNEPPHQPQQPLRFDLTAKPPAPNETLRESSQRPSPEAAQQKIPVPPRAPQPPKPAEALAPQPRPATAVRASQPAGRKESTGAPFQEKTPPPAPASVPAELQKITMPIWIWAIGGLALLAICGVFLVTVFLRVHPPAVPIEIHTSPPGAQVRINGKLHSAGQVALSPGTYHIEARLGGYQTVARDFRISQQRHGPIALTLVPETQAVRLSTDLESGSVQIDDQPAGNLEDGRFAVDSLKPGKHVLQVASGRSAKALIPFEVSPAKPPVLTKGISAKDLRVILFSYDQGRGHVYCSFGPVPLTIDGQPAGDLPKTGGLDLFNLKAALHELVLGKGRERHRIAVDLTAGAGLFVFISSDRNIGTLEIVTNKPGFRVTVDGKPRAVRKQRNHYYVHNVDARLAVIKISKKGFQSNPPERRIAVRKGETTRVSFQLTALPTTASLQVAGALPGTRMSIDGKPYALEPDGSLGATVKPGEHVIELRRQGYKPKLFRVPFKAGQTVNLSGSDVIVDGIATGRLVVMRTPANARVMLRRRDGTEIPIASRPAEAPNGEYTLIATAPGYRKQIRKVRITSAAPTYLSVKLLPLPRKEHMEGWQNPHAWKLRKGWYTRKGGGFVLFKKSAGGKFRFTARAGGRHLPFFHSGHIQWVVHYVDDRNYDLYQIDKDKLSWKRVVDGKPGPEKREPIRIDIKNETFPLLLEIGSGQVVQKIYDGKKWRPLPQLADRSAHRVTGRFGFFLPGNDQIQITDFEFTPSGSAPQSE